MTFDDLIEPQQRRFVLAALLAIRGRTLRSRGARRALLESLPDVPGYRALAQAFHVRKLLPRRAALLAAPERMAQAHPTYFRLVHARFGVPPDAAVAHLVRLDAAYQTIRFCTAMRLADPREYPALVTEAAMYKLRARLPFWEQLVLIDAYARMEGHPRPWLAAARRRQLRAALEAHRIAMLERELATPPVPRRNEAAPELVDAGGFPGGLDGLVRDQLVFHVARAFEGACFACGSATPAPEVRPLLAADGRIAALGPDERVTFQAVAMCSSCAAAPVQPLSEERVATARGLLAPVEIALAPLVGVVLKDVS